MDALSTDAEGPGAPADDDVAAEAAAPALSFGLPELSGERTDSLVEMPGTIGVQPALAVNASGEPLVVFAATPGSEGDLGIYAALSGQAPIALKSEPPGQRNEPSVCRMASGGFAAAWSFDGQAYGGTLGVEGALMDAQGSVLKAFTVTTEVEGNHWLGHVGCHPDGGFTIVGSRTDTDDTTFGVFAQTYDDAGEPVGAPFSVNPTPEGTQVQPVVAAGPGGNGVVVYEDAPSDESYILSARAFTPSGAQGDTFTLLSFPGADCLKPAVALSPGGALAYAGNLGVQVHVLGAPSVSSPEPSATWLETTGSQGFPALTFLEDEAVVALAMIDQLTGAGTPTVQVRLLGEGLDEATSIASLSDDPQLPPYPPAIAYGAGVLAVAWTQRTESGFALHLSEFQAPVLP